MFTLFTDMNLPRSVSPHFQVNQVQSRTVQTPQRQVVELSDLMAEAVADLPATLVALMVLDVPVRWQAVLLV